MYEHYGRIGDIWKQAHSNRTVYAPFRNRSELGDTSRDAEP
jgi:hypothetical protein